VKRSLAERVADTLLEAWGEAFTPTSMDRVGGGCIHEAWKLGGKTSTGARTLFAKTNERASLPMFVAEADGLAALRGAGKLAAPAAIAHGHDDEYAWLVLDWLELVPLAAASAVRLGDALAAQHALEQPRFGWASDNFIGASPQQNGWSDDWLDFWRMRRLAPQLALAARHRLPSRLIDRGERLAADCEALFSGHRPRPSLLHGDLWAGNAGALADGTPVVFDPAVYCGDREADLAMTELFGGFPPDFASAYRAHHAPADGYPVRRDFYNLYHVLNHANLFSGGYVRQAQDSIERLIAQMH
jgi:fructosamine-3-kinase